MKNMSSVLSSHPDSPDYPTLNSECFSGPVEYGHENLEWAIESPGARFAIVIRDLDRFVAMEELSSTMLEESHWLTEHSELVTEEFGDCRLGIRLRALSAACFEVVRCVPAGPLYSIDDNGFTGTRRPRRPLPNAA